MEDDRKSIGLTSETQALLETIEAASWFADKADIARFCLAYAIRAKVPDGATPGTETRWAAGNFDDTGEIRAVLGALYPNCTTPIRLMEHLVNEGIRMVAARMRSDAIGPAELIS